MKYSLSEYIQNFDKTVQEFQNVQGSILLVAAEDAKALVKKRVIETGVNHEGRRFASPNNSNGYSRKPMLTNGSGFFVQSGNNKKAGTKEKRKELKWVTIKKGGRTIRLYELERGYEEFRELQGRQVEHVDFSYTNRMWSSVDIISKSNNEVVIGAKSTENRKKMEGNVVRFGTILALNKEEFGFIKSKVVDQYQTIMNRNLR